MLGSIRKFSTSIYAKVLLGIIIIPFVFWGMGPLTGGNKNIIVTIEKEKYSIQQFNNFMQRIAVKKIEANHVDKLLYKFIGEKLMELEIKNLGIKLSDKSLSKLIKNQKKFKRENKFSRIDYEKFLVENNLSAVNFESLLLKEEKKNQLLDYIGGGIVPSKFSVNIAYNRINQKRIIEIINLNDVLKEKLNFSEKQIENYFEINRDKYIEIYKSAKLIELNPKKLVENKEFNDLFFKKIDDIDDLIIGGKKLDFIINKYTLEKPRQFIINELGEDINSGTNVKLTKNLIKKIFNLNNIEPTILVEDENKFFIIEFIKTKNIERNIKDTNIRKKILLDLEKQARRGLIVELYGKISKNNFTKYDFDKLSKDSKVNIEIIKIQNQNDVKKLKKEIINEVYSFAEKKIIIVNDIGLNENFLIYIDKVENVSIEENADEYQKYLNLSKIKLMSDLYNTYDNYLKQRYEIDINYQALNTVKNYFN